MARKAKETTEVAKITADDFQRFAKRAVREKQNASELVSSAGGFIKGQIESLGLHAKAAKHVVKLSMLEPGQRTEQLRSELLYNFLNGHFDQVDLFDDLPKILRQILDHIEGGEKKPQQPDSAVTQFN